MQKRKVETGWQPYEISAGPDFCSLMQQAAGDYVHFKKD